MGVKARLFDVAYAAADRIFKLEKASPLSVTLRERLRPTAQVDARGVPLRFSIPSALVQWRINTLFEKEPETIEWIDGFRPDDVLYDIGANVGIYTIYAAAVRKCRVLAFEPSAQNFALLNDNVALNGLHRTVKALNVGLSDHDAFDVLHMSDIDVGTAVHTVGANLDLEGQPRAPFFEQGVLVFSIDSFVRQFKPEWPSHIKIDVDGIEPKVVAGMMETMKDRRLRSVSIELNEGRPDHLAMIPDFEKAGLKLKHKRHAPMFDGGPYAALYNFLFVRAT